MSAKEEKKRRKRKEKKEWWAGTLPGGPRPEKAQLNFEPVNTPFPFPFSFHYTALTRGSHLSVRPGG
jgi:hypothetical protein